MKIYDDIKSIDAAHMSLHAESAEVSVSDHLIEDFKYS